MSFTMTVTVQTETAHQHIDVKKRLKEILEKERVFFVTYGVSIHLIVRDAWIDKTYVSEDDVLCMYGLEVNQLIYLKKFKNFPAPINGTYSKGELSQWMEENPKALH